jgi:uncharacterized protein
MAIAALAEAGLLFDRPDLVTAAADAAGLLSAVHISDQRILRTSRDGVAGPSAGLLEDYACVASGLLVLHGMTGADRWVAAAGSLLDTLLAAFGDGSGGFYDTAADGERLIFRPADPADGATPSGAFAAADALLSYAALSGSMRHRDAAVAALRVLPPIAARYPRAAGTGLSVIEALLSGPAEIAIVGPDDDPRTLDLLRTGLHAAPPGAVFAMGPGADGSAVPLLAGRGLVAGAPTAYVCRGFTCQAPVTSTSALREALLLDWTAGRSLRHRWPCAPDRSGPACRAGDQAWHDAASAAGKRRHARGARGACRGPGRDAQRPASQRAGPRRHSRQFRGRVLRV